MRAGTSELLKGISEKQFFSAKIVDQDPDHKSGDGVNKADGGSFDVFIDVDRAGMKMNILVEPEEIEEVCQEDDEQRGEEGITKRSLKNGDSHQDVILTVVAVGGRCGEGKDSADENRNGGDADERSLRPLLVDKDPTEQQEMTEKAGAHEGKQEEGDWSPNILEELVRNNQGENNEKIEETEDDFLKTRVLQIGCVPA